jgi:hypothetical protein
MATFEEAWAEEVATPTQGSYVTLEVQHSTFDQPARIVANVGDDMAFGIEEDAAVDAGATVTFIACPCKADYPEYREGQAPTTKLTIDNVSRELVPKIREAQSVREYLRVIYREYLADDLTKPAYGPVEFSLKSVSIVGTSLTGTATVAMLTNKRFPRRDQNYDYIRFPSLLPG